MPIITRWIGSAVNRDPAAPRNDGLVRAIAEVARADTASARGIFYQVLLGSRLLAVRQGDAPEKALEVVTGEAEPFGFSMAPGPQGKPAVAVYTDIDALVKARPDARGYVAFEARPLFEAISNVEGGVVINFGSGPFAHVLQQDVRTLSRGEVPTPPKPIQMRKATPPDAEILDGIKAAIMDDPRIVLANYFSTVVEGKPERNALGVRFSPAVSASDMDLAMRKLISRVARTVPAAEVFDFVLLNRAGPLARAEAMFPPFYTRAN